MLHMCRCIWCSRDISHAHLQLGAVEVSTAVFINLVEERNGVWRIRAHAARYIRHGGRNNPRWHRLEMPSLQKSEMAGLGGEGAYTVARQRHFDDAHYDEGTRLGLAHRTGVLDKLGAFAWRCLGACEHDETYDKRVRLCSGLMKCQLDCTLPGRWH